MRLKSNQAIEAYIPPWAKKRSRGLGLQRGGRQFMGREEKMFGKQIFA